MAAANPDLLVARADADRLYAEFPPGKRDQLTDEIRHDETSPFRERPHDQNDMDNGVFFAISINSQRDRVPSEVVKSLIGFNVKKQIELLKFMSAKMREINPPVVAPVAGGRRRKSTTRVRVRGRPSTRTTRRATYGARRRATSARAVRARRPSK